MRPSVVRFNKSKAPFVVVTSIGNPEPEYRMTRHSAGHEVLNAMNISNWRTTDRRTGKMLLGTSTDFANVMFLKCPTYMNISGSAIGPCWNNIKELIGPHATDVRFVCVHDELSKAVGKYQVRYGNCSSRGHNGLKSIVSHYGNDFFRFGVGIGKPQGKKQDAVVDYVLGKIPKQEWEEIVWKVIPEFRESIEKLRTAKDLQLRDGKLLVI